MWVAPGETRRNDLRQRHPNPEGVGRTSRVLVEFGPFRAGSVAIGPHSSVGFTHG
jgi:hypothetical protein